MWRTFLPRAFGNGSGAGQGDPFGLNERAAVFAAIWQQRLGDTATRMRCDARLVKAAQGQADWLAAHDFDARDPHLGAGGSTANERVRATGYQLPSWWPEQDNNAESAIRSWGAPSQATDELMAHVTHYDHMHIEGWFVDHVVWGVGAAAATIERGGVFYVVVTAPREG